MLTGPPTVRDRLALAVATLMGAGHAPIAPGTVGSAFTAFALWLVPLPTAVLTVALVVIIAVGTWAAARAERVLGGKDPGAIVVDEVAGMILSVLLVPRTVPVLVVGFVLFRIFDVTKPYPARTSQRLAGGVGVMIDDVIAGLYALAVLLVLHRGLGWL